MLKVDNIVPLYRVVVLTILNLSHYIDISPITCHTRRISCPAERLEIQMVKLPSKSKEKINLVYDFQNLD